MALFTVKVENGREKTIQVPGDLGGLLESDGEAKQRGYCCSLETHR